MIVLILLFLFRVTSQLGYLPSDMLKKPLHEFCLPQDQAMIKDQMKLIFETKQTQPVQMTLHFVPSSSSNENNAAVAATDKKPEAIKFKTSAYAFCNPCNEAFEFIVCTHVNQSRLNELNTTNNSTNGSGFMYNQTTSSTQNNNSYMHHIQPQQVVAPSHLVDPLQQQQQQSAYPVYQSLGTYNLAGGGGAGAGANGTPAAYMPADAHSQLQPGDPQSALPFYSTNYLMMSNKY